jgi:hypothetical protein
VRSCDSWQTCQRRLEIGIGEHADEKCKTLFGVESRQWSNDGVVGWDGVKYFSNIKCPQRALERALFSSFFSDSPSMAASLASRSSPFSISALMSRYIMPIRSEPSYTEVMNNRANPCAVGSELLPHSRAKSLFASFENRVARSSPDMALKDFARTEVY